MKLLKKISTCISVSFITIGLFAQNPDYQAHLAKGKEYEEQKKCHDHRNSCTHTGKG